MTEGRRTIKNMESRGPWFSVRGSDGSPLHPSSTFQEKFRMSLFARMSVSRAEIGLATIETDQFPGRTAHSSSNLCHHIFE